ncbi:hypothetical protein B0H11DRAFT_1924167 [Mycena galericulata]|nr:hypothetical protein B0H11DRAFT_1929229 [Mycena galericulata]KAJ7460124.1 hypothetical protein B0H11DRAFT_1924167 [Mycena galericulata]
MAQFSPENWTSILTHCVPSTIVAFALVSRASARVARPELFYCVRLSFERAPLFFRTLQETPILGRLVSTLILLASPEDSTARHEGEAFKAALASMERLHKLRIHCRVDVNALARTLRAPIHYFLYAFDICDDIMAFLDSTPTIHALTLYGSLGGRDAPLPLLPNLESVQALLEDLFVLIADRAILDIKISYQPGDLSRRPRRRLHDFVCQSMFYIHHLEAMACQFVDEPNLRHWIPYVRQLSISQDETWGTDVASAEYPRLAVDLCKKLKLLSGLSCLTVVTAFGPHQPAERIFIEALREHYPTPELEPLTVVFHTAQQCFVWNNYRDASLEPVVRSADLCDEHHWADGSGLVRASRTPTSYWDNACARLGAPIYLLHDVDPAADEVAMRGARYARHGYRCSNYWWDGDKGGKPIPTANPGRLPLETEVVVAA